MTRHRIEIEFDSDIGWAECILTDIRGALVDFEELEGIVIEVSMTPIVDDAPPVRISHLTKAEIESVRRATNTPCGCERCRLRRATTP